MVALVQNTVSTLLAGVEITVVLYQFSNVLQYWSSVFVDPITEYVPPTVLQVLVSTRVPVYL
jgi:hypothetical protein